MYSMYGVYYVYNAIHYMLYIAFSWLKIIEIAVVKSVIIFGIILYWIKVDLVVEAMSTGMVDFYPFAGYKLSADSKDHLRAAWSLFFQPLTPLGACTWLS